MFRNRFRQLHLTNFGKIITAKYNVKRDIIFINTNALNQMKKIIIGNGALFDDSVIRLNIKKKPAKYVYSFQVLKKTDPLIQLDEKVTKDGITVSVNSACVGDVENCTVNYVIDPIVSEFTFT